MTPKLHRCYFCGYDKVTIETKKTGTARHYTNADEIYTATVRCKRCHARGPTQSYTKRYLYPHSGNDVLEDNIRRETEGKRLAACLWNTLKGAD